ncbi:VIT1/CCC1 transporter family protein [Saccharopolyspora sp. CA-218241]|uniref:VIT1/CCC1 transporter family protein n=1 Tax=Saccharopolyspora sp. CA-218241 TaxID=3240027 RepID=UPI003D99BE40
MPDARRIRRWRRLLADEREEAAVYRELAERRRGEEREILLGLADAEERHAAHWVELLGPEADRPARGRLRMRVLVQLAKRFGSVFVLALAQRAESRTPYRTEPDATEAMAADELVHEEVVRALASRGRARLSGTFRAAVFGANDGLVSNLALVLGVIGGGVPSSVILLTGLSGLLAGALSMGAGEYISVRSQRELLAAAAPGTGTSAVVPQLDVNANELALVYRARGMSEREAREHADEVLRNPQLAPVADRPGQDHEVVGTGLKAAMSSFCFFAAGAAVPVLPFLGGATGPAPVIAAAVLVGLALMLTGAAVGVMSGAPPLTRALRQLAIGYGAAAATYVLGLVFGATVG